MYFVLIKIPFILLFLKLSECTIVEDVANQKGIHVSDYCPTTKGCPEGTHVMCMYYKPNAVMGSQCIDPRNVSMTVAMATKILDIVNAIRSKVANGKETIKKYGKLPRGYGINRLRWDGELATFAQVLANQCLLRHDVCRATKRFHYPTQTVGLVRFTRPDWFPVVTSPFKTAGLDLAKLNYAIVKSIYSWYNHKESVTPKMIENYPDWSLDPGNNKGWHYLKLIYGAATHMGCGISAYAEYHFKESTDVVFNSVQVVCNYSAGPKKGGPVYNQNPPTEVGYTIKCGCPEGFEEDIDCLCNEIPVNPPAGPTCDGINCEPAVVILPIFTVEDAPQHKLVEKSRKLESDTDSDYLRSDFSGNMTNTFQDNNHIHAPDSDIFQDLSTPGTLSMRKSMQLRKTKLRPDNSINQKSRYYRMKQGEVSPITKRRMLERRDRYPPMEVRHRYFGKSPRIQTLQRGYDHVQQKIKPRVRPSIFSRVHKFELPTTKRRDGTKLFTVRVTDIKRDVAPRKDFSYSRKLLNTYLDNKRHHDNHSLRTFRLINYYETSTLTAFVRTTLPTPNSFHNFSDSRVKINRYMANKFHYPEFNTNSESLRKRVNIKSSNEESDKKLMDLLDNLEQEVNHIDLNMNEKEIFDAKIRKIYGSVVGRDDGLLSTKITNDRSKFKKFDSNSNAPIHVLEDLNKATYDDRIFETEDKVKELHLKLRPGLYSRSAANINRHSMEYDEKNREPKHCKSDTNSCILGLTDHEDLNRPYFEEKNYKSGDKKYAEQIQFKEDIVDNLGINDMKTRNMYKTDIDSKKLKDDGFIGESRKNVHYNGRNFENNGPRHNTRYRNEYRSTNGYKEDPGDPLGVNRRKQYQQKLENLERRLHDVRGYRRRNVVVHERERAMRLVRPPVSRDEVPLRPSVMKSPMSPIYMPERARFLHGF